MLNSPGLSMHLRLRALFATVIGCALTAFPTGASAATRHHQATTPLVVILDPGHGGAMHYGNESGAVSPDGTLLEKNMALLIAKLTAVDLQKMGFSVYLTRTKDQPVNTPPRDWNGDGKISKVDELMARAQFANRHHGDIFVAIHFDGSLDQTMHGTHGYYCPARPFWRNNLRLATLLTNHVVSALQKVRYPDVNRGIATDASDITPQTWPDYPWFLQLGPARWHRVVATQMPGALIETLFMSSPMDDAAMRKPQIDATIARGYADGILEYFHGHTSK
jgi:N-acetylmuramoyl-L-alanine amidase